jgi:hypothetical protein
VTVRLNASAIGKTKDECRIEFMENALFLEDIIKQACKKLGSKAKEKTAKIYDKNGVDLGEDDVQFIKPDDIIYIALDGKLCPLYSAGESFNFSAAILDDYIIDKLLGEGGYGKVHLAIHR